MQIISGASEIYGLDLRGPYRLANFEKDFFIETTDIAQLSKISPQVVIAVPDVQVLENKIAPDILKKILCQLSENNITVKAIETESQAIARMLCYVYPALSQEGFGMVLADTDKIGLGIFLNQQKIFFHEEKLPPDSSPVSLFQRFLKLFKIKYPDMNIKKYFYINNINFLLSSGLSLWNGDEKTCQNLLPREHQQHRENQQEKIQMLKKTAKLILAGILSVLLIHLILLFFLHTQTEKITALDKKINFLQPRIDALEKIQQKTLMLKANIVDLKSAQMALDFPVEFLDILSQIMPEGVFLNTLSFQDKKIILTGRAQTQAQIKALLASLAKNKIFQNPSLESLSPDNTYPPYDFSFVINLDRGIKS